MLLDRQLIYNLKLLNAVIAIIMFLRLPFPVALFLCAGHFKNVLKVCLCTFSFEKVLFELGLYYFAISIPKSLASLCTNLAGSLTDCCPKTLKTYAKHFLLTHEKKNLTLVFFVIL